MEISIKKGDLTTEPCDLLVVNEFEGVEKPGGATGAVDKALGGEITEVIKSKEFKPKLGQTVLLRTAGKIPANKVLVVGLGKKKDFDIILFDSPPVIAVTDPAILSTKVDCTLLVVASGQTNKEAVTRAQTLLQNVEARLIGVLLNNVDMNSTYGSKY